MGFSLYVATHTIRMVPLLANSGFLGSARFLSCVKSKASGTTSTRNDEMAEILISQSDPESVWQTRLQEA